MENNFNEKKDSFEDSLSLTRDEIKIIECPYALKLRKVGLFEKKVHKVNY